MSGRSDDAPLDPARFIRELAEYERLLHEVEADEAAVDAAAVRAQPPRLLRHRRARWRAGGLRPVVLQRLHLQGRCGIYLEDLYVRPEARGQGAGKALLAGLARRCVDGGLGRLEWAVLDWNAPSIAFYDSLGAASMTDWIIRRLTGEALARLAAG